MVLINIPTEFLSYRKPSTTRRNKNTCCNTAAIKITY
jgi:hypothetical protein